MDPDLSRESVGEFIRSSRVRRGMTQRQLAGLSTVSVRTIRDLESGRTYRPNPHTIRLLFSALGIGIRDEVAAQSLLDQHLAAEQFAIPSYQPPTPVDDLVGRDDEVLALCDLLPAGDRRLVTITGLVGVGKTRVAMAVADLLRGAYELPVRWVPVELAPGRRRSSPRPGWHLSTAPGEPVAALAADDQPALVVFDGCGYDRQHAGRVAALLRRYPRWRVLVTARAPLDLPDERVVPLAPLPVPLPGPAHVDVTVRNPAVRVMMRSVRLVRPTFSVTGANAATVAELCRQLDGVPELLERIARSFLLFDPDVLLDGLRVDPAGLLASASPGLAEAVALTVSTLDPAGSALLRRLFPLDTPWSVEEVAKLCGVSRSAAAGQVSRLLERGLVRPAPNGPRIRFQVLNAVRLLDL